MSPNQRVLLTSGIDYQSLAAALLLHPTNEDRLYMPPQIENLLLAAFEQTRRLSPFATDKGAGALNFPKEYQPTKWVSRKVCEDYSGWMKLTGIEHHDHFPNSVESAAVVALTSGLTCRSGAAGPGYLSYGKCSCPFE